MMKYLVTVLLLNALFISAAHSRNCVQALHNKHCSSSSGNSASQSQTTTATGAAGQTPDPAQTNSHLGSGSPAQNQVVNVYPLPPKVFTGTSLVTLQTLTAKPHTFTGQNVQVHPLPPKVITGTSLVTLQTLTAKPHTFTGQNVQVNPVPTPIITGTSRGPLQPIIIAPPKTFTGQNVQVNPVPTPIITGTSAGPLQPITTAPPKTFTGQNIQVNPVPTPIITGTSAVPVQQTNKLPPKTFASPPKQRTYPVPTPIFIGKKPVSATPLTNVPALPNTQTPNNVPPLVTTTPVATQPPKVTPKNPPIIITHVASHNLHPDILLQQQMLHSGANLKSIEPHINNLPVDVYTDKNVHNATYEKSTTIDSKGFHLTTLGIKEATFADTTPPLVAVNSDDIIFNFNYASADIHQNQLSQIDKIIAKHSKNGKRIILMGETDGFGSETYNTHLALLRAHKIINELKKRGVKVDDIEIRILVRCCRKGHPTKETLAETTMQRITWVHFQ